MEAGWAVRPKRRAFCVSAAEAGVHPPSHAMYLHTETAAAASPDSGGPLNRVRKVLSSAGRGKHGHVNRLRKYSTPRGHKQHRHQGKKKTDNVVEPGVGTRSKVLRNVPSAAVGDDVGTPAQNKRFRNEKI